MIGFIDDHHDGYGVEPICKVLPIAPSPYHERVAQRRDPRTLSARARRDLELKPPIARVFADNVAVYGVRKVTASSSARACRTAFDHFWAAAHRLDLEEVSRLTWVPVADIQAAAYALGAAKTAAYYTWTGLSQHETATQTDRALATLMSLKGSYDAPGGHVVLPSHPVNMLAGEHLLDPELRRKTVGLEQRPLGPPATGRVVAHDFYTSVLEGRPYRI